MPGLHSFGPGWSHCESTWSSGVSKQRARRREEAERLAARQRAVRQRRDTRTARRRHSAEALRGLLPTRTRYRGQQGLLARRRRAQNSVIVLIYLAAQAVVWLIWPDL